MFEQFQEFRKILCVCPKCGEIVRLSDLKLKSKVETPDTWLDTYDRAVLTLEGKEMEWKMEFKKLQEEAKLKARKEADAIYNTMIKPSFRKMNLDPRDIHPVLNPIDFVVFRDMNKKKEVTDIMLLAQKVENPKLATLRTQVQNAINDKKYEFVQLVFKKDGEMTFK